MASADDNSTANDGTEAKTEAGRRNDKRGSTRTENDPETRRGRVNRSKSRTVSSHSSSSSRSSRSSYSSNSDSRSSYSSRSRSGSYSSYSSYSSRSRSRSRSRNRSRSLSPRSRRRPLRPAYSSYQSNYSNSAKYNPYKKDYNADRPRGDSYIPQRTVRSRSRPPPPRPPPLPKPLPDRISLYPLSRTVTQDHITEIASLLLQKDNTINTLKSIRLTGDPGASRLTAVLEFFTDSDAGACLDAFQGAQIDGLTIKATRSKALVAIAEREGGRDGSAALRRRGSFEEAAPGGGPVRRPRRGARGRRGGAGGDSYYPGAASADAPGGRDMHVPPLPPRRGSFDYPVTDRPPPARFDRDRGRDMDRDRDRNGYYPPPSRDYQRGGAPLPPPRGHSPARGVGGLAGRGGRDRSRSPMDYGKRR
ncbi:hypothetical protein BC830DRAFT_1140495 [Chytriomyces sp. MP71]|nr:hypothetical protein BC830DRAFT_1140495 [Chytriomyces sp. MP71]